MPVGVIPKLCSKQPTHPVMGFVRTDASQICL